MRNDQLQLLKDAVALRDRVHADLATKKFRLAELQNILATYAERNDGRGALSIYENEGEPSTDAVRDEISKLSPQIARAEQALRETELRVRDTRARATDAFVASQGRDIAALSKRFRNAAQQLVESFDAMKAWEAQFESAGLNSPTIELLESIALGAPRCGLPEFERHVRTYARKA